MSTNEKMCRLCLNTDAVTNLFIIDGNTTLDKKIRVCIDLKISIGDGLPGFLCKSCENKIKNFYDFKQKCLFIDSKLRAQKLMNCSQSPNKLTMDDPGLLTDNIKIDIKLECDDVHNKIDLKKTMDIKLECDNICNKADLKGDTWLSHDIDSECYDEYFSHHSPINENQSQPEQLHNQAPSNTDKMQAKTQPRKLRKSKFTGQNLYQCEICGRILTSKSALMNHITTHSGLKQFSCKLCSKTFTRAEHKVIHMRTHLGIKPYICEKCGKSFTKRQDMVRHMRIHSDVKNYACPRCDRKFKRSGDVHSHMRTHTGAKPYRCGLCDKRYTSHSGLSKHNKTHFKKETVK